MNEWFTDVDSLLCDNRPKFMKELSLCEISYSQIRRREISKAFANAIQVYQQRH